MTAIAALAGTSGLLRKTAADTWSLDTAAYLTGNQTISVSGDATGSGTTGLALTVSNNVITNAKLATVATATIKGRTTAGTGNVEDLTPAQARGVLGLGTADSPAFATLGIGVTPAGLAALHIKGLSIGNSNIRFENTNGGGVGVWEINPYTLGVSDQDFEIRNVAASVSPFHITQAGRVGINVNPGLTAATLHVLGNSSATEAVRVQAAAGSAGTLPIVVFYNGSGLQAASITNSGMVKPSAYTFAALPSVENGAILYCSDCTVASPCASGGLGAIAKGLNSNWVCN